MSAKSKAMCVGCRNDYYNGKGADECWSYRDAQVVTRYRIGWWTAPTVFGAFTPVETLRCHSSPGNYGHQDQLPDFVSRDHALGLKRDEATQ